MLGIWPGENFNLEKLITTYFKHKVWRIIESRKYYRYSCLTTLFPLVTEVSTMMILVLIILRIFLSINIYASLYMF